MKDDYLITSGEKKNFNCKKYRFQEYKTRQKIIK